MTIEFNGNTKDYCFRLTIRNVNKEFVNKIGIDENSFRLTIRNVNNIEALGDNADITGFRLTIRNVN